MKKPSLTCIVCEKEVKNSAGLSAHMRSHNASEIKLARKIDDDRKAEEAEAKSEIAQVQYALLENDASKDIRTTREYLDEQLVEIKSRRESIKREIERLAGMEHEYDILFKLEEEVTAAIAKFPEKEEPSMGLKQHRTHQP